MLNKPLLLNVDCNQFDSNEYNHLELTCSNNGYNNSHIFKLFIFLFNIWTTDYIWTTAPEAQRTNLESNNPLVHVLPHAHLYIELGELLVSIGAGRAHVLTGGHVLREIQHVPLDWGKRKKNTRNVRVTPCVCFHAYGEKFNGSNFIA